MSDFKRQMKEVEKKISDAIEKTMRATALEMFSEIVLKTPVDTGRLRSNWQASLNNPIGSKLDGVDYAGNNTIIRGGGKINSYTLKDSSIWFANNMPYASRIENGSSRQRPEGMVSSTISMFKTELERIAKVNKV